ncbi:MAG: hypothetical protein JWM57_1936, partial [Phycisphaerales bacterium]|nr:hypothetical protein [Phycisphaerales bacterium]
NEAAPKPPEPSADEIIPNLLGTDLTGIVPKKPAPRPAAEKSDDPKLAALGGRQADLRNLLDELLKKASEGKTTLGAEPDNKDQLPEEADAGDLDQKDLEDTLLGGDLGKQQEKVDKDFKLVGTRMARSRQRLAINSDPGRVTQEIQKRILTDLDNLIDLAHKNAQQQQSSSGKPKPGQQPKPGDQQQAGNQGQNKPAEGKQEAKSTQGATNQNNAAAGSTAHDLKEITERADEWGKITPRVRQAVIDSRGEAIVEQYRKMIEDYYGALSNKGGKKQ